MAKSPIKQLLIVLLFSGAVLFLVLGIRSTGYLEHLELVAYDWFIRMQPDVPPKPSPVVIIGVTESDIRKLGRWPISDRTMANMLQRLVHCGARVIGLDIYRDIKVPPGSEILNSVLMENRNIITVMKFGADGVPAPQASDDKTQVGFNDIIVDPGGIVRRGLLFLDDGKKVYYSFSLRIALHYLRAEGIVPQPSEVNPQFIVLGGTTITPLRPNAGGYVMADSRGYQFLIDYKSKMEPYAFFTLMDLLSDRVSATQIKNKAVIIGVFADSIKDFFYTPHSRGFYDNQEVPGVVIHASLVNQIIEFALEGRSPKKNLSEAGEMLWILSWSIVGGLIGFWVKTTWRIILVGTAAIFLLFSVSFVALLNGCWIPFVPPALTWMISAFFVTTYASNREKKQRSMLMQLFSRYVSPEVAEAIWSQRADFLNGGRPKPQKMTVTVMFADITGFTSISETLEPNALVEWLNTYMEAMTKIAMTHGGVVDDYAGDGVKINFGVPFPRNSQTEINQDAVAAVNCALSMEKELARLNEKWKTEKQPQVATRIGIFTGPVIAAALGSIKRLKYTTIGDTVNIAARLENYDKQFAAESPCRIIIGDTTRECLGGQFNVQSIGYAKLKGKQQQVDVFHVLTDQMSLQ
jgi:adenylate cyclase